MDADHAALERVLARTRHEPYRALALQPGGWAVIHQVDADLRAAKPRVPLGSPQGPPADCVECHHQEQPHG